MKTTMLNETSAIVTMKVGFLDVTFITEKSNTQFAIVKNPCTGENLTRLFNKEGMNSSFLIKDDEILDLLEMCKKFTMYCEKYVTVSQNTTYENIIEIYRHVEEILEIYSHTNNSQTITPIINIKGDLVWYLTKDRLHIHRKQDKVTTK